MRSAPPATMRAMLLEEVGRPLRLASVATPEPASGQVLIEVSACAVCRTDLHVVDGELPDAKLPLIPGHQAVGRIVRAGTGVGAEWVGARVGVPWLGWTCGECRFCLSARENLCERARFTGYHLDGGFAEYMVADVRFCFPIPPGFPDLQAAPLLCAGLIGYRALGFTGEARRIGIYGFGAAAHIVAQVCAYQGKEVFAFTRAGDATAQEFARELGAVWTGDSESRPPEPLDAAIVFAPVGDLVVRALRVVDRGGVVVCGGIHMSDIPAFPYELLWQERMIRSVANLTRRDGEAFLALAPRIPVRTHVRAYPLESANRALSDLRDGRLTGAAVLVPSG